MSEVTRTVLKSYFETGDVPTQAQFIDLIDSVPNIVDDNIPIGADPAVTAFAGGGQANATVIDDLFNTVTVCASPGDSVRLPDPGAGMWCGIVNATANSCNVFPQVGGQIMALGVNVAQAVASGERWLFACSGTNWASFQSA